MYTDFEYANRRLSDFGCIICSINGNSGDYELDIGCDITFAEVKNNHSSIHSKTSSSYDNVYTTTFDIIKYNCNSDDDMFMTSLEARNIVKWLNRRNSYHKFRLINDISDESNVHYYGSFNVKQRMFGDKILGLTLTFKSNAPYGFADVVRNKFMMLNPSETITLYGDSDEYGLIYPKIEIRCFSDSNDVLEITNQTTGTTLHIDGCTSGETITLDGEHKIILSDKREQSIIANAFNYEYLDILVDEYETENIYSSTLPCELTISYLPIRKVGVI